MTCNCQYNQLLLVSHIYSFPQKSLYTQMHCWNQYCTVASPTVTFSWVSRQLEVTSSNLKTKALDFMDCARSLSPSPKTNGHTSRNFWFRLHPIAVLYSWLLWGASASECTQNVSTLQNESAPSSMTKSVLHYLLVITYLLLVQLHACPCLVGYVSCIHFYI